MMNMYSSQKNEFQAIKEFWSAPIFTEFDYHEQRDSGNDISWLIEYIEKLQAEVNTLRDMSKFRGRKVIRLKDELRKQSEFYEGLLQDNEKEIKSLKDKLSTKEVVEKATNSLIREQSRKIKHLFPLEDVAGYGQLCDKVLKYEKALKDILEHEKKSDGVSVWVYGCVKEALGGEVNDN